ncbi:MAG: ATP-binding cassette domain-containing protein [Blautia sp.]
MRKELLRVEKLNKSYGNQKILKNVSFQLFEGETVVVIGSNGAGKTTLMKILAGILHKDSGQIFFRECPLENHSIAKAKALGIEVIFDHKSIIEHFSISENIFLTKKKPFLFNPRNYDAPSKKYMEMVNLKRSPKELVSSLPLAEKAKVQIAAALTNQPQLLILDEPPILNSAEDKMHLKHLLDTLKAQGSSVIFITHVLEDALLFADRILILREGASVFLEDRAEISKDLLLSTISQITKKEDPILHPPCQQEALRVENLNGARLSNIHFHVQMGEILGIIGSIDSGNDQILETLFGLRPGNGKILVDHVPVSIRKPQDAVRHGISYSTTCNVECSGLLPDMSIMENLSLHSIRRICDHGIINKRLEKHFASTYAKRLNNLNIKLDMSIDSLSSGTKHKLQIAQCITNHPKILLLYEPISSIDPSSQQEIFDIILALAAAGTAIIIAASTTSGDSIQLCHRVLVMQSGHIKGELSHPDITLSNIIALEQQ